MRAGVVVVFLAGGCGFSLHAAPSADAPGAERDGVTSDAANNGDLDADGDATSDAPMVSTCTVVPAAATAPTAGVGGTGGTQQGTLACGSGELPIGLQFDVTPQPITTHANQLLMVHVRVRCGRVTRTTANAMTSAPQGQVIHLGLQGSSPMACNAYVPVAPTTEVTCPSGQVLVGIAGNQVDTTLYNSVSIRCATVTTAGTVTATSTVTMIGGTGAYTNAPEAATCPAGSAIVSFVARSGCGQDSLTPACAPLTCP